MCINYPNIYVQAGSQINSSGEGDDDVDDQRTLFDFWIRPVRQVPRHVLREPLSRCAVAVGYFSIVWPR